MDASYKIQRGIHVHLIQFFMCPEFWVHIIREQLCWILNSQLRDTAKASLMLPDGSYCRKHSAVPFDSQDTFMQQSPHIPAAAAGAPKERVHWLKDLTEKLLWA